MTPMTPSDLNAMVAERVMQWMWKRDQRIWRAGPLKGQTSGEPYRYLVPPDSMFRDHTPWDGKEQCEISTDFHSVPAYSTDISAAFLVVEKMQERLGKGWVFSLDSSDGKCSQPMWCARFRYFVDSSDGYCAQDDSLPRAICLAALKALGE